MIRRLTNRLGGLAAAACLTIPLLAGCASAGNGEGGGATAAVEVRNDLIPPTALTIYVVPETGGVRRLLGNVGPSQTRVLTINDPVPGQHRLMARTTLGQEIFSNRINIDIADTLRWDLSSNIVTGGD